MIKRIFNRLNFAFKPKQPGLSGDSLEVTASKQGAHIKVKCGFDTFNFEVQGPSEASIDCMDFAVWLCLPVAMVQGKNLTIIGKGTLQTKNNAEKLSDIWTSWLPKRYSMIDVSFSEAREHHIKHLADDSQALMCFSGGIDSTYSLMVKDFGEQKPDILTVQGMDYGVEDNQRFELAKDRTQAFVNQYIQGRLFVKSNAYDIYKKYGIGGQLSHVFLLSAIGFLFSYKYSRLVLAADHSFYQQFEVFPAGSTFASNPLFNSGDFYLETHGESVTRAEKLDRLATNSAALYSASFCKNRKVRPKNCGKCSKCLRTKYMFLANIGEIPSDLFIDPAKPTLRNLKFSNQSSLSFSYIKDTYKVAFRKGHLDLIPDLVKIYRKMI